MSGITKEQRIERYRNFMRGIEGIPIKHLDKMGFFDVPASINHHGTQEGDLFEHSLAVAEELVWATDRLGLVWKSPNSPYIVGMYHDLVKCLLYVFDDETGTWVYNKDILMPDHGAMSVIIAQKYLQLTEEEIACIRWHMGAFEKETKLWEYYTRAIKNYPNVLYTHMADMAAAHIRGI